MAANKCFTVLAPNGRRQTVKVTPNTTILQVLEEVCNKQGLRPEEYDIKHHNHVLDTSQVVRFTGLPNNAFLEMAAAHKTREEKNVVLGLQLESGNRITGDFLPTASLWDVIKKLCPEEADPNSNPVIIYMRREVCGMKALTDTTLRSLGLTSGRAMLRFVHRTPEELHHQANVSTVLLPRPVETVEHRLFHKQDRTLPEESSETASLDLGKENMDISESEPVQNIPESPKMSHNIPLFPGKGTVLQSGREERESMDIDNSNIQIKESYDSTSTYMEVLSIPDQDRVQTHPPRKDLNEEIILLGERNAIAFNLEMAQPVPYEDLPDDFFELTLEDARAVYRDLKRKRSEMEEAPLATSAQRGLEESKRVLNLIHNYRKAVIRIHFPDRTVLQGTFLPLETVNTVMEFVRKHLETPETDFYLYTTPPKNILSPGARLVDAGCVPSAMVHFGTDRPGCKNYLKEEILTQFSSPSAAALAACQSRGIVPTPRPVSAPTQATPNRNASRQGEGRSSDLPSTSTHAPRQSTAREPGGPSNKVPKWFKPVK